MVMVVQMERERAATASSGDMKARASQTGGTESQEEDVKVFILPTFPHKATWAGVVGDLVLHYNLVPADKHRKQDWTGPHSQCSGGPPSTPFPRALGIAPVALLIALISNRHLLISHSLSPKIICEMWQGNVFIFCSNISTAYGTAIQEFPEMPAVIFFSLFLSKKSHVSNCLCLGLGK